MNQRTADFVVRGLGARPIVIGPPRAALQMFRSTSRMTRPGLEQHRRWWCRCQRHDLTRRSIDIGVAGLDREDPVFVGLDSDWLRPQPDVNAASDHLGELQNSVELVSSANRDWQPALL